MKEFIKYRRALDYAIEKYGDLKRKVSHLPYVIHPLRISAILRAAGFNEFDHQDMMIATLFHDLVEDTDITLDDIRNGFGAKIASIVDDLTHPYDMPREKKDDWLRTFSHASTEAKIVKMADRIDNLLDMGEWELEKQKSYATSGKIILETCKSAHPELGTVLEKVINDILAK